MMIDHVSTQHIVVMVDGAWEVTFHILTPGQSRHLRRVPAAAPCVAWKVKVQIWQDIGQICGRDPGTLMWKKICKTFVKENTWSNKHFKVKSIWPSTSLFVQKKKKDVVYLGLPSKLATMDTSPVPAPSSSTALSSRSICSRFFSKYRQRATACVHTYIHVQSEQKPTPQKHLKKLTQGFSQSQVNGILGYLADVS